MVRESAAEIFKELNQANKEFWFNKKEKKFLHTIDTFYYSIKLKNDFTSSSEDSKCLSFREFFKNVKSRLTYRDDVVEFYAPGMDSNLLVKSGNFDKFYNIHLQLPQQFDMFVAEIVPEGNDGICVTSEIIVQIRSALLWEFGATKAFEFTYKYAEAFCNYFGLEIEQVKENRTDFCWHTNYLQNPEKYFMPDKMNKMFVSRLGVTKKDKGVCMNYRFKFYQDGTIENDYIAIGKRSDKCFLRIYNKTKEVVQEQYKGWFFKEWLFNGLINRYDFDILERCYKNGGNWGYKELARLEWYLEHGKKEFYKKDIRAILDGVVTPAYETICKLADKLTPKITIIMNIEFQVMRKMTKTMKETLLHDNNHKGVTKRIYDFLDMHSLITEYLTHDEFRLIDRTEENKSRCDYNAFWKALRSTKFVDVKKAPKEIKLKREYTRNLDAEIVKKRALSASISYNLYKKGLNDYTPEEDAAELFCILNDNDIEYMNRIKAKRKKQLNKLLMDKPVEELEIIRRYAILNKETGEIF